VIDATLAELEPVVGVKPACVLVGRARATRYRAGQPVVHGPKPRRPAPRNAMTEQERDEVLAVLRSPAYCDLAVAQVWARELDQGRYYCSISSMYRILRSVGEVSERRRQATHPPRVKPELVATAPNQVWSWDITKLKGPDRGVYYDLYVILDIFSRYVTGWLLAPAESGELAKDLIADAISRQGISRDQLTIHADRGTSMTSKPVSALLVDLGVIRSHSRPHVSNDNPYSEAQFKTLKYCPAFPDRFGSIEDARTFIEVFMGYYCHEHRHSGIGLHTPASVHYGTAHEIHAQRAATLTAAYATNPHRFTRRPTPPKLPTVAWINPPPAPTESHEEAAQSA
jgi:putative transposase